MPESNCFQCPAGYHVVCLSSLAHSMSATYHLVHVQVNGKLRATLELRKAASKEDAVAAAQGLPAMAKYLDGKDVKKIIYVPSKILNLVVK